MRLLRIIWSILNFIGIYRLHVDGVTYILFELLPVQKHGEIKYNTLFTYKTHNKNH